ncbi:MAG: ATP-binding protein involved in chromosome partitioning [Chloroflexia bacterium]|jgi:ATP-binding protein involved in chromosome partitioning|nr:ATP-binding protein involved in chromosome partitioning [Chloroflexia bacterium]
MSQPIKGVSRIVLVASGKGGVGKTTVTVNLALGLAAQGARVGLFDADVYGPNVPLMLGVHRTDVAEGWIPIGRAQTEPYIKPLERFGLKVMSVGLLVGERQAVMPDPRFVGLVVSRTLKDVLWGELDYLLVDLPPGTGEPQQSLVKTVSVDGVIVVTTPQDMSLMDAGRSLELYRQASVPILGVVENMSYMVCPDCGKHIEVFHRTERDWAVESAEIEVLGRIPMSPHISRGIDASHPLLSLTLNGTESVVFRQIAARLRERLSG